MKVVKTSKKSTNLTDEELKELQTHVGTLNNIISQVGEIEVRKHYAIMAHKDGEGRLRAFRDDLKSKYGDVSINTMTGEITKSEDAKN